MSISEIDEHISRRYNIRKRLGKGAYGIVWKATDRRTNRVVAVKKIFDAFRNPTDAQRTFREIMFLQEFGNHPNIVKLLGIHRATNNRDIYLIFEHMDTDLHNVIRKGNILQIVHIKFIMYQLLKATKFIHSGNVIHRDQKPSNILLNSNCLCKIADFGLARSMSQLGGSPDGSGENIIDPTLTDYVATRWYRAPEILVASKRYTQGIDMWSLGCILAEMLLGKPLFPGTSTINQIELILAAVPPLSQEDMSSVTSNFGSSLLQKAPSLPRQSLQKHLSHAPPDAVDLISKLLIFNPHKRLTATQALQHPFVSSFHQGVEPVMNHVVLPPLRDDVQLSVDEYRNKLYEMMVKPHFRNIKPNHDNGRTRKLLHSQSQLIQPVAHENHLKKLRHLSVETLTPPPHHRGTAAAQTHLNMNMHRGSTLSRSSKGSKPCQIPRPVEIAKVVSSDNTTQRHEEQPKLTRQSYLHRPVHLNHQCTMKSTGGRQMSYLKSENTVLPAAVRVFKNNRNIKQLQQCKRNINNTSMSFYSSQHSNNVRVYSW